MKRFFLILILTISVSAASFGLNQELSRANDSINVVDAEGKKQGNWVITGKMKDLSDYSADQKIEEGRYEDNRKVGVWKKYFPNGKLKSEITYVKNRPEGPYKIFYQNGQLEEEGVWGRNKNIGGFKRYYKNGNLQQDFAFSDNGKRNGVQKYYHENGQLEIEVNVVEGKEEGLMRRYYPNGDLKEEKVFNGGAVDPSSVQVYQPKQPVAKVEEEPAVPKKTTAVNTKDAPNPIEIFRENGRNKLYNKDKQISQDGVFKRGRLWNGKWYRYNNDGILIRVEIYKRGEYIGDGVIEEE